MFRYEDLPLETKDGRSIDVEFVSNVYPVDGKNVIQCNYVTSLNASEPRKLSENGRLRWSGSYTPFSRSEVAFDKYKRFHGAY